MTTHYARILDGATGSEAVYEFDAPGNLMQMTGDEIIGFFFDDVDHEILEDHVDWELNAVMSNRERRVVTAIGSLFPKKSAPPIPFLLMISDHNGHGVRDEKGDQQQVDVLT